MNDITITLTKSQVKNLIEFFYLDGIHYISRRCEDMLNSMDYLVNMCEIYSKLKAAELDVESAVADGSPVEVPTEPKKMTNYDRIKAMTPEELASFMANTSACECCMRKECDDCSMDIVCVEHIRKWLELEEG